MALYFSIVGVLRNTVVLFGVLFSAIVEAEGQTPLFDVLVPPGGFTADGATADYLVQEGDLLLSLVKNPIEMQALVVDDHANQLWSDQTPYRGFYMKPWRQGEFVWYDYTLRKWTVIDDSYNVLDTLTQSFEANDDYHDVHLLEDNTYIVVLLEEVFMDLSSEGGSDNAKVLNPRLLHLDEDENILRDWSGLEHLPINAEWDNLTFAVVDYLHWNAVQFDSLGGVLLSMRNRNQIVRLRPEDWSVHWKLGGVDSDFELTDPQWEGFQMQHDVHDLGGGNILLFDNATFNPEGFLSRAMEIQLDTTEFLAERVWQFAHPEGLFAPSQGSAIRLENGNTLIGWGTAEQGQFGTRISEVTAQGDIAMEIRMSSGYTVYRARKYPPDMLSGCTDEAAINLSMSSWMLAESECIYPTDNDGDGWTNVGGDCNDANSNIYPNAPEIPEDGIDQNCDGVDDILGCLDELASNFVSAANVEDNSCTYTLVAGVDLSNQGIPSDQLGSTRLLITEATDSSFAFAMEVAPAAIAWNACQFELDVTTGNFLYRFMRPDGVAEVLTRTVLVESGSVLNLDVVCFESTSACPGCMDPMDVAFNPWATVNQGCMGTIFEGCTYPNALNFDSAANVDDGSCQFGGGSVCPGDLNQDGSISVTDVLELLVVFGSICL